MFIGYKCMPNFSHNLRGLSIVFKHIYKKLQKLAKTTIKARAFLRATTSMM